MRDCATADSTWLFRPVWASSVQCSNFLMFNNNRDYENKVNLTFASNLMYIRVVVIRKEIGQLLSFEHLKL